MPGTFSRVALISLCCCFLVAGLSRDSFAQDVPASEPSARTASPEWATLVGSAERNKYHRLTCGNAQKIKPENLIWFTDANDATENGYVPAGCSDKKCRPPQPDSGVEPGPVGGVGFPPPDLSPPKIPQPATPDPAPLTAAKPQKKTGPPKVAKTVPPPRLPPRRSVDLNQLWKDVAPHRELAARRDWDVWAAWALDQWCERWHVTSNGTIAPKTAYPPDTERQLMAQFKEMKRMIEQNKKRMSELELAIAGKKK